MGCSCKLRKSITKKSLATSKRDVYLDYNGTTQPDFRVLNEVDKVNRLYWGNPSSQNTRGVNLYNLILDQSSRVLDLLNLKSSFYYFDTSSSSIVLKIRESLDHLTSTTIEHSSLYNNADQLINVDTNGHIDLEQLESFIQGSTTTFIYSPVNHEVGTVQNVKEIYNICKSYGVKVILDSVQAINRLDFSKWIDFCDGFYFSGHKIHSIPGAAMLILKDEINLLSINSTIDFSIYSGTFNSSAVVGLLKALEVLIKDRKEELNSLKVLHRDAVSILQKGWESIKFESDLELLNGIINVSIKDIISVQDFLLYLNSQGIYISRFSACTGNLEDKSRILQAMGRSNDSCLKSFRVSFGRYSKRDDFFRLSKSITNYLTNWNK